MLDLQTRIARLTRPQLLVRAARFGMADYRRDIHLRRLLRQDTLPRPANAVVQLLEAEAEVEADRVAGAGSYSPARHVDLLIAISSEAQLLRATIPHLT